MPSPIKPTFTNYNSAVLGTTLLELEPAVAARRSRVYLRIENNHASQTVEVNLGPTGQEKPITMLAAGEVFLVQADKFANYVPQERISLRGSAATTVYGARIGIIPDSSTNLDV